MTKFLFPIFIFFTFGLLVYGFIVNFIFSGVANKFNFYGIHYNELYLISLVALGTLLCCIGRNLTINNSNVGTYSISSRYMHFSEFLKYKGPFLGVLLALFFIGIDGITFLPERIGYRIDDDTVLSTFLAFSGLSGLFCIPLLALAWGGRSAQIKFLCFIVFVVVLCCYYAKASRVFALAPLVYFFVALHSGIKAFRYLLIFSILASPITISFILELRGQSLQGFFPFVNFLIQGYSEYAIYELFLDFFIGLASGFYIFVETANSATWMTFSDIWISLNPSFGVASGWTILYEEYRLNEAVPYSSIGELVAYSKVLFLCFCFVLGVVFGRAENNVNRGEIIGVVQIVILIFMAFQIPQYNLRSIFRFFYLICAIELLVVSRVVVLNLLRRKKRS